MRHLFTPWRYRYVKGRVGSSDGCIFCSAHRDESAPEALTAFVGEANLVLLNRFPYTNGHLMIAPLRHAADVGQLSPRERSEMMELVAQSMAILDRLYRPDGYNVGMNVGECAGAGIPDHLHLHVVPRWKGDTNFMTALAETRLVPEDLAASRQKIREAFLAGTEADGEATGKGERS